MSNAPHDRRFRPVVEGLEERAVPSTSPVSAHEASHHAHPTHHAVEQHHGRGQHEGHSGHDRISLDRVTASSARQVGAYSMGGWNANGDSVFFFALTYTGKLTAGAGQQAWINGFHRVENSNIALDNANTNISARTSAKQHFLIGWQDPGSDAGGWIAADANPDGTLHYFVGRPRLSASDNEHSTDVTKSFSVNGTSFQLEVTAISGGHLVGLFTAPA